MHACVLARTCVRACAVRILEQMSAGAFSGKDVPGAGVAGGFKLPDMNRGKLSAWRPLQEQHAN